MEESQAMGSINMMKTKFLGRNMTYRVIRAGESLSFPDKHAFLENGHDDGSSWVFIGKQVRQAYRDKANIQQESAFVLLELGTECLGVHIGDDAGPTNVLGFARFRLGKSQPTNLVELVRKTWTDPAALEAAKFALENAGLVVAVCQDFPGRILNRLLRPYYNAALKRLDEGLATANDMDATLRMGLGYPEGPIELLQRTGLEHHFEVSQALFEQLGQEPYCPAPRARTAWLRAQDGD